MSCPRCGHDDTAHLTWRTFKDGSRHVRAGCRYCGAFLGWWSQTADVLDAVDETQQRGLFS